MLAIGAAALLLAGDAIATAPLCRDTKGLFTPCPPGTAPRPAPTTRRVRAERDGTLSDGPAAPARTAVPSTAGAVPPPAASDVAAAPAGTRRRHARLCRDGKGLMKPC